jgi:alanyl-tRNA synthetase
MTSKEIRQKFIEFFKRNNHVAVPSSSLLPENDPSVLFTTAGMQQFKPYYVGAKDAKADFGLPNAASVQKCLRTSDIDEVGDDTHLTFFEMLGNFSFGGYFKEHAIKLAHEFITKELKQKLDYVSIFRGEGEIPEDLESEKIWQAIDPAIKIVKRGMADNFWGPTGEEGPCGPTTEIYLGGVEIWNIVFNEYFKDKAGNYTKLETPGVDTGMGLERLVTVLQNKKNIYETDLFAPLVSLINLPDREKRIVADHVRAAVFLIADGVMPSNTGESYVLRRLIRRAVRFYPDLSFDELLSPLGEIYNGVYDLAAKKENILGVLEKEKEKFQKTLAKGLKEFGKLKTVSGADAFYLYETFGFPFELTIELAREKGIEVDAVSFEEKLKEHQERSRLASAGQFKGGLADDKPETVRLHTAHHLLLAALQKVLGSDVKQRGSNITSERLRLDFSFDRKLTDEEKKKVEAIVNENIQKGLPVVKREMPKAEAEKLGAEMEFGAKYGDTVCVYLVGEENNWVSREFCGGPHAENTRELGVFKIQKEEAAAAGIRRIKAVLVS